VQKSRVRDSSLLVAVAPFLYSLVKAHYLTVTAGFKFSDDQETMVFFKKSFNIILLIASLVKGACCNGAKNVRIVNFCINGNYDIGPRADIQVITIIVNNLWMSS
jgi:hypothetical protein